MHVFGSEFICSLIHFLYFFSSIKGGFLQQGLNLHVTIFPVSGPLSHTAPHAHETRPFGLSIVLLIENFSFVLVAFIEGSTVKALRQSMNLRRVSNRIEIRENNLREKIEMLKKKIVQTRQYASNVKVL